MFTNLSNKLLNILYNINHISKKNIKDVLYKINIILIESDVALPVIKKIINQIEKAFFKKYIDIDFISIQKFINIIYNELVYIMGDKNNDLNLISQYPSIILLVGLQGSGKTSTIIKLGKFLNEKNKKKILIVSTDIYRPAAIDQLRILSKDINIDFFSSNILQKPIDIVSLALNNAKNKFYDILLVDTAGRLHIDKIMMKEIKIIHSFLCPIETLFVMDSMFGQNSAYIIKTFNDILSITGIILTKVDSDTKGGAALSIKYITGKPIKFITIGEKNNAFEKFYPDRIANQILGRGDIKSLIENITNKVDIKYTKKMFNKFEKGGNFNLNDFLEQLKQIQNIGGVNSILKKLPNINFFSKYINSTIDDTNLICIKNIINSMTKKERLNPKIIEESRKRRIASGCGMKIYDVNCLLKQFNFMYDITEKMKNMKMQKIFKNIKDIFKF
ncbi:MAG: signal recognition particle protein [gamma proteobacterium endosymbiont of Trioza apicalis]